MDWTSSYGKGEPSIPFLMPKGGGVYLVRGARADLLNWPENKLGSAEFFSMGFAMILKSVLEVI